MSTAPAVKTCIVCGQDVNGKPRVKDAQGRYGCIGDCQTALAKRSSKPPAAPRPAAPPPAPADNDLMANLVAASPMQRAGACPTCNSPMMPGSVVCMRCGFNTHTGKNLKTAVIKVKEDKQRSERMEKLADNASFFVSPLAIALYIMVVLGGIGVAGAMIPDMALPALIIMGVAYLIAVIMSIVEAFRDDESWMGWFMIVHLIGLVPSTYIRIGSVIGFFCVLYYSVFATDNGYLRAIYLGTLIALGTFIGVTLSMDNDVWAAFRK